MRNTAVRSLPPGPASWAQSVPASSPKSLRRRPGQAAPKPGCSSLSPTRSTGTHCSSRLSGSLISGFERLHDLDGDRGVGPVADVEHRSEQDPDVLRRDGSFFLGLAQGAVDCFFALMQGSAGESPGAALIAPQGAVLEQDALGGVVDQQPRRAEAPPEPAAVAFNPGITGIAGTEGTAQLEGELGGLCGAGLRFAGPRVVGECRAGGRGNRAVHAPSFPRALLVPAKCDPAGPGAVPVFAGCCLPEIK